MTPAEMAEIHQAAFTTPRPWHAAEFAQMLASPLCYVATAPGGFAIGRCIADEAELLTIAVRPDARRKGAGRQLLQAILTQAKTRGAEALFLEVADGNNAAIGLYLGSGFRLEGRRPAYYNGGAAPIDALIFRKPLDDVKADSRLGE
ncbi:MAG: ribosomal protein S18-alanine N-acetyltransferase [Albidovulum sp.]